MLPVRETVTATELDSDVAVCASAKEVAQIMTKKAELIMIMINDVRRVLCMVQTLS